MDYHKLMDRLEKLEGAFVGFIEGMTDSEVYALHKQVTHLIWKMNEEPDEFGDDLSGISASLESLAAARLWDRIRKATKAEEGRHASMVINGDTVIALHTDPHDQFTACYSLGSPHRSPLIIIEGPGHQARDDAFRKASARWTANSKGEAQNGATRSL